VWEYNSSARRWGAITSLEGHTDLVHDVSWAPNLGRAYHLVATACKDGSVRIFRLNYSKQNAAYTPQLVAKLDAHAAEVWRVSWNVSGTLLASTGDDGVSRLWKADFNGQWHPVLVAAATPQQPLTQQSQQQQQQLSAGMAASASSAQQQPAGAASSLSRPLQPPSSQLPAYATSAQFGFSNAPSSAASGGFGNFSGGSRPATMPASAFAAASEQQRREEEVKFSDHRSFN
jgi:hypothetical protein